MPYLLRFRSLKLIGGVAALLFLLSGLTTSVAAQNLVSNGACSAAGPADWSSSNVDCQNLSGTFPNAPISGQTGSNYFATEGSGIGSVTQTITNSIAGGATYDFEVYIATFDGADTSQDGIIVELQFQDGSGTDIGTPITLVDTDANSSYPTSSSWELRSQSGIPAPAGANQAVLTANFARADGGGFVDTFLDAFSLVQTSAPPTNTPPTASGTISPTSLDDDAGPTALFDGIDVSDPDPGENDLALRVTVGNASAGVISGVSGTTVTNEGGGVFRVDGSFDPNTIDTALDNLRFSPTDNTGSSGTFNTDITVQVDDQDSGFTDVSGPTTVTITRVNDAPTISGISDQTIAEDATLSPVDFTVSDPDDAASNLTLTASSDNQTLVPDANITLGGSGSNRTIEATPAANENGTANITVEVTDSGSLSDASTFILTVNAVNDPPMLTLSTTTPSLDENNSPPTSVATITITDDNEAGSDNILSLSGTDAGSFQINGSDLEFTEVADFETKTTYDVTVEVDDPNVGTDPDDSESLTLTITNVNEAPTATTDAATSVTTTAATLNGTASTGGGPDATVTFTYFPTANPTSTTQVDADQSPISSDTATPVSVDISGLTPNTEYGFRVEANNTEGNAIGSDATFTTSGAPAITVTDGTNTLDNGSGTFDFGTVDGVASSPEQTFTIENNGSTDLTVTSTALSNTTDFTLTQTPSSTVAAGASTDFAVQFATAAPGPYTTTVTIDNSDTNENPYTFDVTATAGAPEADVFVDTSPRTALPDGGTFDFGTVTAGVSSTETFTIENNGDATLNISPPSSIPGAFNVTATGGTTPPLAPGEAFTFNVEFAPSSASAFSESFSVTNSDPDENPYDVTLEGTGEARELTVIDGSVDGLDFDASVAPGTANNAVGIVALSANASGAVLEAVTITSNAPGIEGISVVRLFGSNDATLNVGSDTELASVAIDNTSAPETVAFTGFSDPIPTSVRYLILAIDVDAGAPASDVQFFLDQPSDLTINGAAAIATVNGQGQTTFASLPLSNSSTALPVEMTAFNGATNATGTAAEQSVDLQWKTASEMNNAGFEVQRRADSTTAWTALGFVEGAGTTDETQSYRFRDADLPFAAEQLTYRLRQVDTDGTESFSEPFVMDVPTPQSATLRTPFPNPARDGVTLRYTLAEPTDVQLQIYDLLGRRVSTLASQRVEAGRHEIQVPTHELAAGTYFVRMLANGTVATKRLTIIR
ncbi:MAG: choice-of-anchor D domain-containing protein [Longimonas sp.]|uniref:choice-of-anchor D domain-containing protein n=1 Tax=Longimonas sp. TaxID=2039626 RepID=UPI0039762981